jgi:hypothetical protein
MNFVLCKIDHGLCPMSVAESYDMNIKLANTLIAVNLNLSNGSAPNDIDPMFITADEFLFHDYPPSVCPTGKIKDLAGKLKNTFEEHIEDHSFYNPVMDRVENFKIKFLGFKALSGVGFEIRPYFLGKLGTKIHFKGQKTGYFRFFCTFRHFFEIFSSF